MQARDPKQDRPPGSVGRPAFGIGPIARVSRPTAQGSSSAQSPAARPASPPTSGSGAGQASPLGSSPGTLPGYPARPPFRDRRDHVAAAATGSPYRSPTPIRPGLPGQVGRSAVPIRSPMPALPPSRGGFGLPNLRRNVCPHFYMTGSRGAIPIQAPHLLKALIRQDANVSRCQLRGGVHLEQGYINDVCLTPRFNQCVFYEDDLSRE